MRFNGYTAVGVVLLLLMLLALTGCETASTFYHACKDGLCR